MMAEPFCDNRMCDGLAGCRAVEQWPHVIIYVRIFHRFSPLMYREYYSIIVVRMVVGIFSLWGQIASRKMQQYDSLFRKNQRAFVEINRG